MEWAIRIVIIVPRAKLWSPLKSWRVHHAEGRDSKDPIDNHCKNCSAILELSEVKDSTDDWEDGADKSYNEDVFVLLGNVYHAIRITISDTIAGAASWAFDKLVVTCRGINRAWIACLDTEGIDCINNKKDAIYTNCAYIGNLLSSVISHDLNFLSEFDPNYKCRRNF